MVVRQDARRAMDGPPLLEQLVEGQNLGRHAFFFVTGEGTVMPNGVEDASGYVIDEQGRVFAFWLGWDDAMMTPALTEWEEVTPESAWLRSTEYQAACERVGLH